MRLYLELDPEERRALCKMASDDLRTPRDQLRHLLREAARARGLAIVDDPALSALAEAARRYGHEGDYEEVAAFVRWCYAQAGREPPDLEPYERDG